MWHFGTSLVTSSDDDQIIVAALSGSHPPPPGKRSIWNGEMVVVLSPNRTREAVP